MGYRLGVDLGTTFTAAAIYRDGRTTVVSLGDHADLIPSVVFVGDDGTTLTGDAAERRALTEPERVAREFKRRLGDPTPFILGGSPYSAEALTAMLLRSVLDGVGRLEGGPPDLVTVTHPATWGPYRMELLGQALRRAGLEDAKTLPEPEAAAIYYASKGSVGEQAVFAVYDLGGGTFDATVLRRRGAEFSILGKPDGIDQLGGSDFDEAVVAHVRRSLGAALEAQVDDSAMLTVLAELRRRCVEAKEALSTDTAVVIPVLLPTVQRQIRLTRAELEEMIRPPIGETIACLRRALVSAEVEPDQLSAVLLVGGSSRTPLVSEMLSAELGRPVAVDAHPKYAIALGAAISAARVTGDRTEQAAALLAGLPVDSPPTPEPPTPEPPTPEPPTPEPPVSPEPWPPAAVPMAGLHAPSKRTPSLPAVRTTARRLPPRLWTWAAAVLGLLVLTAVVLSRFGAGPGNGAATTTASIRTATTVQPTLKALPARIKAAGVINVGSVDRFGSGGVALSPMLFSRSSGKLAGFDYDLAQAMGDKLDVEFRFQTLQHFTHSFSALEGEDGEKVDVSMSVLHDQELSRSSEGVDFIDYLNPRTELLVRKGTEDEFRSADDLCGRTVARSLETPPSSILSHSGRCRAQGRPRIRLMTCPTLPGTQKLRKYANVELLNCPANADPLQLLIAGKSGVDAAILDAPLAARARVRTPAFRTQLETAPLSLDEGPYGIAVRRSDRQLRDAIQSALQAVIADGTYGELITRWKLQGHEVQSAEINGGP